MGRAIALLVLVAGCDLVFPLHAPVTTDAAKVDDGLPEGTDATDAIIVGADCPVVYQTVPGTSGISKYRHETGGASWTVASADCVDDLPPLGSSHTHLVVLGNQMELDAIISEFSSSSKLWIGLTDRRVEGTFFAVSTEFPGFPADNTPHAGSPPWGTDQPDDSGGNQDCVVAVLSGTAAMTLEDDDCNATHAYICECDGSADDPTKY